jgi:hypothetical protein
MEAEKTDATQSVLNHCFITTPYKIV